MANVDLRTKEIFGATKGTKQYYHEEAHLKFENKCYYGNIVRVFQDLSFKFLVFVTAFAVLINTSFFNYSIVVLVIINIFSELYEEGWCIDYAKIKMRRRRDDARIKTR